MDYNVIIIGGGVVGLACSCGLPEKINSLLIERHPSFGRETSSRNSEVIHAGIYYPKETLKAKLCVPGNRSLYEWCGQKKVPHNRIGKFIIAVTKDEEEELENIFSRAKGNRVENIVRASLEFLRREEPNVKAVAALWSPDTGIVDSHNLMQSFLENSKNCDYAFHHTVTGLTQISGGWKVEVTDDTGKKSLVTTEKIINSAGLDSDTIAALAGMDIEKENYRLNYVRGHYFRISNGKKHLVNHLIYPAPLKNIAGLGIHVTLEMSGGMKLGPDVQYLPVRIQDYSIPEDRKDEFYSAASLYLEGLKQDDIYADQAGIRPKLQKEGGSFCDWIIRNESDKGFDGLINLIGIESPGLTSCIEIAKMVREMV